MAQFTTSLPLINLNTADKATLATLPGIGPELAQKIINLREKVQGFETPIEIVAVPGISETMYHRFADIVTVSEGQAANNSPEPPAEAKTAPPESASENKEDIAAPKTMTEEKAIKAATSTAPNAEQKNQAAPSRPQPDVSEAKAVEPVKSERDGYKIIWPGEETTITTETDEFSPTPTPKRPDPVEVRGFRRSWLLMVVGALLGTLISLGVLYVINDGALVINRHPAIMELNHQLTVMQQREKDLQNEVTTLRNKLNEYSALDTRLLNTETNLKVMQQSQKEMTGHIETVEQRASIVEERAATLENRAAGLETKVTTLQDETGQMQETLTEIETDTGRFNQFLSGLAELLSTTAGNASPNQ